MRKILGKAFVVVGHLISTLGCSIRGYHIQDHYMPWYCIMCGRHKFDGRERT